MRRHELSDEQWALIEPLLPTGHGRGGQWKDHRQVFNGMFWRLRTGAPWRDIRDNSVYQPVEDRPLSPADKQAGVVRDQIAWLGCAEKRDELRQPLRIIRIACTPHRKSHHNGRGGPEQGDGLLIATDLLDLPAEAVALIYRKRWTVEIFFRFFKHVLGCRHLLSPRPDGIRIQVYMAIIACMLIVLWTGRKPTLRTVEMIQFYFVGWAEQDELEAHIAGLKPVEV